MFALLPEMSVQPAEVEGVAAASPRMLPTRVLLELSACTWKSYSVPLVRLPTVAEVVVALLLGTSVHVTLAQSPVLL